MKLLTNTEFIIQANAVHCNTYDYRNIPDIVKLTDTITVIDPLNGEFNVTVRRHLMGQGHKIRGQQRSANAKRKSQETFISQANDVHNNLYDYSKVIYFGATKKVCIIDPEYGEFWQSPGGHLSGQGHPERGKVKTGNKKRTPVEEFIKKANVKHSNLYDYSKVIYTTCDAPVCIIDPEYGEFWQSPWNHLHSHGCPARTKNKQWLEHIDHIIPLSIIRHQRVNEKWYVDRPLFKFLNSSVNLQAVPAKYNFEKSDMVTINNKTVSAATVRNNYEIISYLIKALLHVDPAPVIEEDKKFVLDYFNLQSLS